MLAQGGIKHFEKLNKKKSQALYDLIDANPNYHNNIHPDNRSLTNVTFKMKTPEEEQKFIAAATQAGLLNLKGHRLQGGMRASLYNAMPWQGVERLLEFMEDYSKNLK